MVDHERALIVETIVTTRARSGQVHIAPLGLIAADDHWVIAPFSPSTTLDNLRENPCAVANHVDDVRIFAGCLTGRKNWPMKRAEKIDGAVLKAALSHWELKVECLEDDDVRPRFYCRAIYRAGHKPWTGYNRAQAAVLEAAVLVSRLKMLPREKIESELEYLQIAISKTAGAREEEAWGWLMEKVEAWRETV